MARLPTKYDISPVGNLASNRPMAQVDLGGEARGMQQAGAGLQNLGSSITAIGAQQAKQDRLIQGTQAETDLATDRAAREEALRNDTDYGTLTQRWAKDDGAAIQRAALRIKDPKTRELFTLEQQKSGLGYNKRLSAVADAGIKDGRIATLETAWQKSHDLIANPATPDDVRTRTKTELDASITEGAKAGVFSEQYANDLRRKYVDGADYALAGSLVKTPDGNRVVIPAAVGGMGADAVFSRMIHKESSGDPTALSPKGAMGLTQLMPGTARETAEKIGINLPNGSDADLHKFFATPTGQLANLAIGKAYFNDMLKRYDGDTAAAVVAYNGGPLRANAWLKAGRDDSVLPAETRDYKKKILGGAGDGSPQTAGQPRANYATIDNMGDPLSPGWKQSNIVPVSVAGKSFEVNKAAAPAFQGFLADLAAAGYNFKTAAGYNYRNIRGSSTLSQHSFGNAIDLNAENNGQGQDKNDFGGIDVAALAAKHGLIWGGNWSGKTKDPMHFEWAGPNGAGGGGSSPSNDSPYATAYQNLRTRFPNLSAEQIDNLATSAVTAKNGFAVQDRAAVEQAVQDGPSALANTGRYDGPTLDRGKFQEVYGQEGERRFNAYDAAMKTAKSTFDMQTQSQTDIMAQVEQARTLVQNTTGEGADLADKRLNALQTAAAATIKARENDPPAAAMQAFPVVKQAWDAVTANPGDQQAFANAIKVTNAAQEQWGLAAEKRRVLPGSIADGIVEKLKMKDLEPSKALATLGQAVFATNDPLQQEAIFDQLKKAGVPAEAEGALRALHRGDTGNARFLMEAATAKDVPWGTGDEKPGAINDAIAAAMSSGSVAGVFYGLDAGSTDNIDRYQADRSLFTNAVKLKMLGGKTSATAITEVQKALYGDARVVDQGHVKLTLPASVDADQTVTALGAQLPTVKAALERWGTVDASGGTPAQKREAQFQTWDRAANINKIVNDTGVWRNLGSGYGFMDATTGLFVAGKDGKPLVVTDDDLASAAKVQANAAAVQEKAAAVEAAKPITAIPLGASGESIQLTPDEVKAANPAPVTKPGPVEAAGQAPAQADTGATLTGDQKLQMKAAAGEARKAKDGKWYRKNPAYKDDPTKPQWIEVKP